MTFGLKGAGEEFMMRQSWETDVSRPSNVTVGLFNDSVDDLNDVNNVGAITTEPEGTSYSRQSVAVTLETDNVTIESAEQRVQKELQKRINDSGTGEITVLGKPNIRPYDRITARPTCASVVENVNPLTHQVSSVRHEKKADTEYLTHVGVSPVFDPSEVEITQSEMKDV